MDAEDTYKSQWQKAIALTDRWKPHAMYYQVIYTHSVDLPAIMID